MFGKFYESTFTGSMMGKGPGVFAVWAYIIAHTKPDSYVEINPKLIAILIGMDVNDVVNIINSFCTPDVYSRSKAESGRRLIKKGEFIYKVVNYNAYRNFRSDEERKVYMREYMKKYRNKNKNLEDVNPCKTVLLTDVNPVSPSRSRSRSRSSKGSSSFFNDGSLFPSPLYTNLHLKGKNLLKKKPPLKEKILLLEEGFNKFWTIYPWKVAKAPAFKAWTKLCPDSSLLEIILSAVEAHKKTKQWQDKQFIPRPLTWLNQKRWEDELEEKSDDPWDQYV